MKAVTMYRPNPIENALNDFDRYFETFFADSPLSPSDRIFRSMENRFPAVDVRETEKSYELEMDLPGYDEKNIEVHLDGGSLSIESKLDEPKEEKKSDKEGTYLLRERRLSSFRRSFRLPENADSASVSASFKNGILRLEIGKHAEAQKRVIQIKAE
jgi:HSP20 family protein